MTEVAYSGHSFSYSQTMDPFAPQSTMSRSAPRIEMIANPDFVFPRTLASNHNDSVENYSRRPQSFHANNALSKPAMEHRRVKSTMPLPTFSFNASDTSGLVAATEAEDPVSDVVPPSTPSRGHKRTTSEFVGGDSRLLPGGLKASPRSASTSQPMQIPTQPQHRHRRSAAISSNDIRNIMQVPEPLPRLSSSAPNSPSQPSPPHTLSTDDPFGPASDEPTRPPSRRQVEFADKVEFIPRPLSTISSGTEGSLSTMRGHSVNNSISSMLSLGTPSPPAARMLSTLESTPEAEPVVHRRSSIELTKRVEREGQWLRTGTLRAENPRPTSAPLTSYFDFASQESPVKSRATHKTKDARTRALENERRKSAPLLQLLDTAQMPDLKPARSHESHLATSQSLCANERKSSTRKLKDWAVSMMSRNPSKRHSRVQSDAAPSFEPVECVSKPAPAPLVIPSPIAETDLDAVFGGQTSPRERRARNFDTFTSMDNMLPTSYQPNVSKAKAVDDEGCILDLDAALGPFKTPAMGSHKQRRELHSSRLNRDYLGSGSHYLPNASHRRTESAPMLTPFDHTRLPTPTTSTMADVFEEEEEEENVDVPASRGSTRSEETGTGVAIVDSDVDAAPSPFARADSFGERDTLDSRLPLAPHQSLAPAFEHRTSVVEDTIHEEVSPVESTYSPYDPVEIVEAHEEPRAPSLTKSSDSSETPTLIAAPDTDRFLSMPASSDYQTRPVTSPDYFYSACSTPDIGRGQSSFDTSRLGTSASSATTDNRTVSSYTTIGDNACGADPSKSVDDVPSLTSSRSTMMSMLRVLPDSYSASSSRRDFSNDSSSSAYTAHFPLASSIHDDASEADSDVMNRRRKRQSIQSLSQLMSGSFGNRSTLSDTSSRPQTATVPSSAIRPTPSRTSSSTSKRPIEHRLKKLMFWKSKSRQGSGSSLLAP